MPSHIGTGRSQNYNPDFIIIFYKGSDQQKNNPSIWRAIAKEAYKWVHKIRIK